MGSDSEDGNLEMLPEAVDPQFLKDMCSKRIHETHESEEQSLASLRRNVSAEDDSYNFFKVSPEFQLYVSKQLSLLLDKQIDEILMPLESGNVKKKKMKGGVRLLKTSMVLLKHRDRELVPLYNSRVNVVELNDEELEERCRLVAVKAEDVLSKKDVKYWKSKPSAKVFSYKKDSNGQLLFQNPPFK